MRATRLALRDFRNHGRLELDLGEPLTVVCGPNGAGKTNVLEGLYFASTGRSCRTANERELPRWGTRVARTALEVEDGPERHRIEAAVEPGETKLLRVDGAAVESLADSPARPLVSVFLPDRMDLVKGPPSGRRAHLDQIVAGLWPSRAGTRRAYARALAQRNALIARLGPGAEAPQLDAWDAELARHGAALIADRARALGALARPFARLAAELGLPAPAELEYRPRSRASDADGLAAELAERRLADLERGFTAHGPHRDELVLRHAGKSLRTYGSQGQQRIAVLALLFAERELFMEERDRAPLMLLDDVMSELDTERRERLAQLVAEGGQTVMTTTEAAGVPGPDSAGIAWLELGRPAVAA